MNARLDRIEICSAAGVQPGHLIGPPPAVVRSAFSSVPGWDGDRAGASDRLAAARARRSQAGRVIWAWLDAVDAECATGAVTRKPRSR